MSDRIKHRLGSKNSAASANVDNYMKIDILNNERILPIGEVNEIVDVGERFNKERQASPWYRLVGTVRPLISNPLFNITGTDSWEIFDFTKFRDRTYPMNNSLIDGEDITYKESIKSYLKEIDGWFGYYDPNEFLAGTCNYIDMEPKRHRFDFKADRFNNDIKNWELTVTYPSTSATTFLTTGGLFVFDIKPVTVGGRSMTAFGVPVLHNVGLGETVRITGTNLDGDYTVSRIGMDNGDLMGYYFVIDVDPNIIVIGPNTRFKKVVGGQESVYYWRIFEKVATRSTPIIEDDDYEIYPLNFANNIYNDGICQFVFNEDIEISGLTDNLGRPLSELFITMIKTKGVSGGTFNGFTDIKSGIEIPFMPDIQAYASTTFKQGIPDIRRIHDGGSLPLLSHTPLESNLLININGFFGDVVEYNRFKVTETILADVYHRFNTVNRIGTGNSIAQGPRQEGYYYKAHQPIVIRNFSTYIEQGDIQTEGIPDYAEDLGDGRWLWRDYLDIGFNEGQNDPVNYPFLNGAHYIHQNYCVTLKRQDPFGFFGLYFSAPNNSDPSGDATVDNFVINNGQNVC